MNGRRAVCALLCRRIRRCLFWHRWPSSACSLLSYSARPCQRQDNISNIWAAHKRLAQRSTWRLIAPRSTYSSRLVSSGSMPASTRPPTDDLPQSRPRKKMKQEKKEKKVKKGSATDEVLLKDIQNLWAGFGPSDDMARVFIKFEPFEVQILKLNSSGDGMGLVGGYTAIVPFTISGDKVLAKPYFINDAEKLLLCDLEEVLLKSSARDDSLVQCKYFGKCSGCQMQALSYDRQLIHKQNVVADAFKDFSNLELETLPKVGETCGSPLQFKYRTKITPHFDQPRRGFAEGEIPQIGFNEKGRRKVLDIEECPIATEALNLGLTAERSRVLANLKSYKRGATILLRQHSTKNEDDKIDYSCVTDSKDIITEFIGPFKFQSPAGTFFQNNNAIMPLLTGYVKDNLMPPSQPGEGVQARYLVDAYCGSGLFSITCSENFAAVAGVEIAQDSVKWAKINAEANNIQNAEFLAGSAEALFEKIKFPAAQTSMILDPPRKGCDKLFLDQLLAFSPERIVYVSCCVQTQARDVGYIVNHKKGTYTCTIPIVQRGLRDADYH